MGNNTIEGFRLSPQQKHLWLLQQDSPAYRVQCAILLEGDLKTEGLKEALRKVVNRHEILRTTFRRLPGMNIPYQVVSDDWTPSWSNIDLSDLETEKQGLRIAAILREERQRPFDFEQGPLLRLSLLTLAYDKHLLLTELPSLCADAGTVNNLVHEISRCYAAYFEGDEPSDEPLQYADFSEWQNELLEAKDENVEAGEVFWKKQAEDISALPAATLPFEAPTAPTVFEPAALAFEIDPHEIAQIEKIALENETSISIFLQACWQTLIWRLTGQPELVVFVESDGRKYEELREALGRFAKSLPMRCSFEGSFKFSEILRRVDKATRQADEWQEYFAWEQSTGAVDAETIGFEFEERPPKRQAAGVWFSVYAQRSCSERFKIKLTCLRAADFLIAEIHYDPRFFQPRNIKRIAEHFQTLLKSAIKDPEARVSQLEILSEAERKQLLIEFNRTTSNYPDNKCIHELFEEQVSKTPGATALVFEAQQLNYAELNARANQLAHFLLQCGLGPQVKVGLCVERSLDMIVGLLGILKAGGTYVPLNPEHPKARLLRQLKDIQAPVLITHEKLLPRLPEFDGEVVCLDRDRAQFESRPTSNPNKDVNPQHLVYVIFTSGSTGVPKGVAVRHQSLVNYTHFICKKLRLNESPNNAGLQFASVSTINADLGNTCIFPSLVSGGCLHILNYEVATDGVRFADYVLKHRIDVLKIVPSHLSSLLDSETKPNLLPLRYLIVGGETLSWELAKRIQAMNGDCEVINHYGPTETTVGSLTLDLKENGAFALTTPQVPIGRPIANTKIFILDQYLNPVPVGVSGQLYIGGVGLAQSYLNQPEQTAERFIANPFSSNGAGRLYQTGDIARYLPDGNVEFLGRLDNQVKIRGYRIELAEIEAVLSQHTAVRQVVVLAREAGPGEKNLVAYVVPGRAKTPTVSELRTYLTENLPEYMLPSTFVFLDELPLTRNGKIDRDALPKPDQTRPELQKAFVAPTTPTEELVAAIWAKLLKLELVGINDNFFELGGHSLLATQVISRLRQTFQVELPLSSLFEAPTVGGLAQRIETARRASEGIKTQPITRVSRETQLPLSFAQQRLWLLDQLEPGSHTYNVPRAVRIKGALKHDALQKALNALVARHESLRTTFVSVDGNPVQVIAESGSVPMPLMELTDLPEAAREVEAERLMTDEAQRSFDLAQGPLLRSGLVRLDVEEHILLLNNHHIVSDGWSAGILFEELALLYKGFSLGEPPSLVELPIQYADYGVWQREWLQGEVLERELSYWKQQLDGAPALLELPMDRPRPAVQMHRGGRKRMLLPESLTGAIRTLSRREGTTFFMTLLAAFQLLLSRLSGQEDIVVGSPIAGRTHAEIERLIGFFLNTLVLRTKLSGDPTFRDLLVRVREVALGAYAHQDLPFERLIEELQPERNLSHTPLFQVFLNMLGFSISRLELPGLTVEHLPSPDIGSKFDLTLYVVEESDGMALEMLYNADLFGPDRIAEMLEQFKHLLSQIVDHADEKISRFSLVTPRAQRFLPDPTQLLAAHRGESIQTLFSRQARRIPEQLAIVDQHETWSYRELDSRSNQLANYLRGSGIKSQDIVAIYGHRSASLVWALLGVLKAGAAFVILDPAYPASRLINCLQVAAPRGWLQIEAAGPLPEALYQFVDTLRCCCRLELPARDSAGDCGLLSNFSIEDPEVNVDADDVAYVAFTSGSTGNPKGILGRHGPLTHFASWAVEIFGLNESDRFSMLSGLSHDPLHRDIFTTLQLGATICISDPEDLGDPGRLTAWMKQQEITIANLTPAMGQLLCEINPLTSGIRIDSLRYAFLVGDVLTKRDVSSLKKLAPSLTCVNLYGATETQSGGLGYFTVSDAGEPFSETDPKLREKEVLPLGKGIKDVQLLLLNASRQLVGIGEAGEIYFRTSQLAKGYLKDEALTRERFLLNPFTKASGDRLYRTGDLGRYLPDGNVEYLGRLDRQVKVRGFRIELGEVEVVLTEHPDVRETTVIAHQNEFGETNLVAYVVPLQSSLITATELRRYLSEKLPDYMIPAAFVMMEALPLTPNRKVDRSALPAPEHSRPELEGTFVAPRTPVEEALAGIWTEVLGLERVSVHDNFFDLGGHSLLAVRLMSAIEKQFNQRIPLVSLFQGATIADLSSLLQKDAGSVSWPTLVKIQPRGSRPPLFCVSTPNVNALGYVALSRYLGPDQPVLGLQAQYPEDLDGEHSWAAIDELATQYLEALRAVRPRGPYQFLGMCRGAHIAHEMAIRLKEQGEDVSLVGVLDTWILENTYNWFLYVEYFYRRLKSLLRLSFSEQLSFMKQTAQSAWRRFGAGASAPKAENASTRRRNPLYVYFPGPEFVPRLYNGRISVFRIRRQPLNRIRDAALGWTRVATGGVEIHTVPGAHGTVLREPNVGGLAAELKKSLLNESEQRVPNPAGRNGNYSQNRQAEHA